MADITLGMKSTILSTSVTLGAAGILGAFSAHSDLLVIAPAWAKMFASLSTQAGRTLSKDKAMKVASGILVAASGLLGGAKLANTYFAYTGVGTVPAIVVNTGANAVITWLAGRAWAHIALETDLEQSVENLVRAMLASLTGWLAGRG